jgi:DNA replicative helicase MCM subunit Mcm2 (Cdc46/Mcm family)
MTQAYEEIVVFLEGGTTPQSLIDFRSSETTKAKVADLIHRQKTAMLSADETAELNCVLQMEHIIRLAKARARLRLSTR